MGRLATSSFLLKSVNALIIISGVKRSWTENSQQCGGVHFCMVNSPFQVVAGMLANERLSIVRAQVVSAFSVPINLLRCSKS